MITDIEDIRANVQASQIQRYRELVEGTIVRNIGRKIDSRIMPERIRTHQLNAVDFALEKGCAALFLDTGLGKSLCAFAWADNVARETGLPVLMLSPLGVTGQHKKEAAKFGYEAHIVRDQSGVQLGLNLTNYERLHLFNPTQFGGLILDESSIIKNFSGKTTRQLMDFGACIPFRLACTATPAPNDHMEIGQHAQFLGVMSSSEMLSRWFIADQSSMGKYRLKRYAINSFWDWVSSWARCAEKPSDLGGDDTGYNLPSLNIERVIVKTDITTDAGDDEGQLRMFRIPSASATSIHKEKRMTADDRAKAIAEIVNDEHDQPWIIWVETDYDAAAISALLPDADEVNGKMTGDQKEAGLAKFTDGLSRILITKASIAGYGLNWQHCARVAFMGLSYSYEGFYQATRRCWRYGQDRAVNVYVASAETEEAIWQAVSRKRDDHDKMKVNMRAAMARAQNETRSVKQDYQPTKKVVFPKWIEVKK